MFLFGDSNKKIQAEKLEILNNIYKGFETSLLNYSVSDDYYLYLTDVSFDERIRNKSLLTKELVIKLLSDINYINLLNYVTNVCSEFDSNGNFVLKLVGKNFEIVFSGCNCGYVGEGSNASYEIIKPIYDLNGLDSSELLFNIENNHLFCKSF